MVTSPSNTLLSHNVPAAAVEAPAGEARGVKPGSGLALKEIVGGVPTVAGVAGVDDPALDVEDVTVESGAEVLVGVHVGEGSAAAVCVN